MGAVDEVFELVVSLRAAGRKDFDGDSRVIRIFHESLMSIVMNFSLGAGRTLLKWRLTVVMSAVGALTSPGCWMRLP